MFNNPNESFPSTLPLLRGLSPRPPFPESPNHQSIDIPLSSINHEPVNDEANVDGGECYLPTIAKAITGAFRLDTNL